MSTNAEMYEQDFYLWCLETCVSLGAREFDAIDVHHLIEGIGTWVTTCGVPWKATSALLCYTS